MTVIYLQFISLAPTDSAGSLLLFASKIILLNGHLNTALSPAPIAVFIYILQFPPFSQLYRTLRASRAGIAILPFHEHPMVRTTFSTELA